MVRVRILKVIKNPKQKRQTEVVCLFCDRMDLEIEVQLVRELPLAYAD